MLKKNIAKIKRFLRLMSTLAQREILSDSTFGELRKIAHQESAVYMKDHLKTALLFNDDLKYWAHVFKEIPDHGLIMEFGVLEGRSINFLAELLQKANDNRIIYGFDSFEGFSEEWGGTFAGKDYFSRNGIIPEVKDNVRLIKGWIEETLPSFIESDLKKDDKIAYIHVDVDTYSPTKCILENALPFLQVGSIIDFDELLGYYGWKEGEFKAFMEVLEDKCKYEYLAFWEYTRAASVVKGAIRITDI